MTLVTRFTLAFSLMIGAFVCHAQPASSSNQSAKEQRQETGMKDKARPDRSKADAKQLKSGQKEAEESHNRKMDAASVEMSMGIASAGASQMGVKGGAKKSEKHNVHKNAVKKPLQP